MYHIKKYDGKIEQAIDQIQQKYWAVTADIVNHHTLFLVFTANG